MAELSIGVLAREGPLAGAALGIAASLPSGDLGAQGGVIGQASRCRARGECAAHRERTAALGRSVSYPLTCIGAAPG
jgi:hypothetical protein